MEVWDIYNENREKTKRTHIRGEEMQEGDFHQVIHVWIMNASGQFLIQRRQPWKKGWANMWDCSAAGSALAEETSEMAAIREVKEELGIDIEMSTSEILFTIKFERGFDDHFL
ncbi:NUDIX domain-containing protein [Psychrobacillus sp. NEAU-3TGS]|nr:NUDIX domain-containing protein [Psychrobacillus sp. NEAU-3TGS]MDI2587077.1 NUDIX domain-containing protein [Psychrobacillus sp. NEAU-3TGS]